MSWMIDNNDPARLEIVKRAKQLHITGTPDKAAHALGPISLADGRSVNAHVVHAVDPIITDGEELVMINRRHDPGQGKPALPGGFIDPSSGGGAESAVQAAAREAIEEAGIDLTSATATLIGARNVDRPFDVRVAKDGGLEEKYGIKQGDIFLVSTQAVRFDLPDLAGTRLVAGDDAMPGSARRVRITSLKRNDVGIPDHFDMIVAAFPELAPELVRRNPISADELWAQLKTLLAGRDLPATPRRPDVRMIVRNTSGRNVQFQNPGDHSGGKPENIPAQGDATAVMIMLAGSSLDEQFRNAEELDHRFDLQANGLSEAFVSALRNGQLADLISEAYGPASFEAQAEKLVEVSWTSAAGETVTVTPRKGPHAAFGARAATKELVFQAHFPIYVQGTGTTAELVESYGICIAVHSDWKTGRETTRPIAPSVARSFYGSHFDSVPAITVTSDGTVVQFDAKNQGVALAAPSSKGTSS